MNRAKSRQSCDSCAASKIKCGRQHPRCQSCLERGPACLYTHLRRSENQYAASLKKATWPSIVNSPYSSKSHAQSVTTAKPSSSGGEALTDAHSGENDKPTFDEMAIKNSSLGFPAHVNAQGHDTPSQKLPDIPGFEYDFNDELDFNAPCASPTPSEILACMPDELCDTALERNATVSTHKTSEFSAEIVNPFSGIFSLASDYHSPTRNPQGSFQGIESCSNHARTCMASAQKIIQALHMPPSTCLSAGAETPKSSSGQPRMTDYVLSTNREAVRLVSDILECTCSLSSQLQLVLVIICGKLTAWYRAMVGNGYAGFNSSSMVWSDFNSNDNVNYEDSTERVLHQPFMVGEYSFDITLENQIRAQVVFSELQHVEALAKSLCRRVEETKSGSFWNASAARSGKGMSDNSRPMKPDESGVAEIVHRSLTVFLHTQLQAAKVEITLILNGGHDSECM